MRSKLSNKEKIFQIMNSSSTGNFKEKAMSSYCQVSGENFGAKNHYLTMGQNAHSQNGIESNKKYTKVIRNSGSLSPKKFMSGTKNGHKSMNLTASFTKGHNSQKPDPFASDSFHLESPKPHRTPQGPKTSPEPKKRVKPALNPFHDQNYTKNEFYCNLYACFMTTNFLQKNSMSLKVDLSRKFEIQVNGQEFKDFVQKIETFVAKH